MTRDVRLASPDQTICEAARDMAEIDAGALPVADGDRLVGMITDRDIAIRAIGQGMGPEAKVRDVMTAEIRYCFEDENVEDVLRNMGDQQLRRLPVLNRAKRLVGIISLCDVAQENRPEPTGEALSQISQPGGSHSQTIH